MNKKKKGNPQAAFHNHILLILQFYNHTAAAFFVNHFIDIGI